MQPTGKLPKKLSNLEDTIRERKTYLDTIERDIEAVTTAGNNHLFIIQGEIEELNNEKARLMKQNYELEQTIRINKRLAEI